MNIREAIRMIRHHLGSGGAYWNGRKATGCGCVTCRWHRKRAKQIERELLRFCRKCTKADHAAMRTLPEKDWDKLGHGKDWDFKNGEILEQRHCPRCGSTLARPKRGTKNVDDLSQR